jgi:signal transduction histidine kinase
MLSTHQLISEINQNKLESVNISNQVACGIEKYPVISFALTNDHIHYLPSNQLLGIEHHSPSLGFPCGRIKVSLWDVSAKKIIYSRDVELEYQGIKYKIEGWTTQQVLLDDNKHLLMGDEKGRVFVLDVISMKLVNVQQVVSSSIVRMRVSDRLGLLITGIDGTIYTARAVPDFQNHYRDVDSFSMGRFKLGRAAYDVFYADNWFYVLHHDKSEIKGCYDDNHFKQYDLVIPGKYAWIADSFQYEYNKSIKYEAFICIKKNGNVIVLGGGAYVYSGDEENRWEISFSDKEKGVNAAKYITGNLIAVESNNFLYICDFVKGQKLGKIPYNSRKFLQLPDKKIISQHSSGDNVQLAGLHMLESDTDILSIISSIKNSTSIKKFTLTDREVAGNIINQLYDLFASRPDIKFEFSESTAHKIEIIKYYNNLVSAKNSEIESIRGKQSEEEIAMHARLDAIEKSIKESLAEDTKKQAEKIQQLEQLAQQVQSELRTSIDAVSNLQEELDTEKAARQQEKTDFDRQHTSDIKQLTQLIKSATSKPVALMVEAAKPTRSIADEVRESKSMTVELLHHINSGYIEDLNLIRFADDERIAQVKDNLILRKAIFSVNSLIETIQQRVNVHTDKEHINRLIIAVDQLTNDYALLPDSVKKSIRESVIAQLIVADSQRISQFSHLKSECITELKNEYESDELAPDADVIKMTSNKIKKRVLMTLFERQRSASDPAQSEINVCINAFLADLSNKLKQCKDPMAAQIAELVAEQKRLRAELTVMKRDALASSAATVDSLSSSSSTQVAFFPTKR